MTKKLISLAITALLLVSLLCVNVSAAPSSWAVTEVRAARDAGLVPDRIMNDYQNPITREEFCEMVVLLYENLTRKTAPVASNPFTDINNPAVTSAFTLGIVNGIGEGLFAPSSEITRQEICTMLARAVGASFPDVVIGDYPNTFPDIGSISDWALKSVKYINMIEVMLGDEEGRINPMANTTREQAILLTYRTKKSFAADSSEFLATYGFVNSGNTSANMLNGTFAVNYVDNNLYIHDGTGIYIASDVPVCLVNEPVNYMYISSSHIYYIKSNDKKLYSKPIPGGAEKVLCDMAASGIVPANKDIYFKGEVDSQIYCVSANGGNAVMISDGSVSCGLPVCAGNTVVYATQNSILSYNISSKETSVLYKGYVSDLCFDNNIFYFKNAEGLICSIDNSGGNYKEITKVAAETYTVFQSGIAFTHENGLYKSSFTGSFCIKIDEGNYEALNSYNNYIYAKAADGSIIKIKKDCSEKALIN